jgi:hypothetical protein
LWSAPAGIYPAKDKMRFGLRKQFAAVLAMPNVHYFCHVPIGTNRALTIQEGTKKLGLLGEDSKGVYSAKDFVYHYNRLPPFATRDFSVGRRIAMVDIGNVMVDIARWLMIDDPRHTAEEVIVIARRGPFEAKFDKKEFANIEQHLDRTEFQQELGIARHDAELSAEHILEYLKRVPETDSPSPRQIHQYLEDKGVRVVNKSDLGDLAKVEEGEAKRRGLTHFKFNDDASMLAAIEQEKARARREKVFIGSDALPIPCLRPSIQLQCALPSEAAAISTFVDNLIHLLRQSRCIPATEDNIEIALREALNNAVVHGNRGDPRKAWLC